MHGYSNVTIVQQATPSLFEVVAFVATLITLGISIYQSRLARKSLDAARKSIDEDKRSRQLSAVPKISWVIQVDMYLERWIKELNEIKIKTSNACLKKDENALEQLAKNAPSNPQDVGIDKFIYDNLPDNLRIILMSGAQYFYNAAVAAGPMWKTKDQCAWWDYAVEIQKRYDESILALGKLKKLTSEIIPDVLLYTPASLNDGEFIRN